MCNVQVGKWSNLVSTHVPGMLRGKFPSCGIKFTGKYGAGLVLVKYDVTDLDLIIQKAKAASEKISYVFVIPKSIAKVYNL